MVVYYIGKLYKEFLLNTYFFFSLCLISSLY